MHHQRVLASSWPPLLGSPSPPPPFCLFTLTAIITATSSLSPQQVGLSSWIGSNDVARASLQDQHDQCLLRSSVALAIACLVFEGGCKVVKSKVAFCRSFSFRAVPVGVPLVCAYVDRGPPPPLTVMQSWVGSRYLRLGAAAHVQLFGIHLLSLRCRRRRQRQRKRERKQQMVAVVVTRHAVLLFFALHVVMVECAARAPGWRSGRTVGTLWVRRALRSASAARRAAVTPSLTMYVLRMRYGLCGLLRHRNGGVMVGPQPHILSLFVHGSWCHGHGHGTWHVGVMCDVSELRA